MCGAIPPLPQYAFMARCSVKAQGELYLYKVRNSYLLSVVVLNLLRLINRNNTLKYVRNTSLKIPTYSQSMVFQSHLKLRNVCSSKNSGVQPMGIEASWDKSS
jgi:hypothetical protein